MSQKLTEKHNPFEKGEYLLAAFQNQEESMKYHYLIKIGLHTFFISWFFQ
jgi:hypothetical protein